MGQAYSSDHKCFFKSTIYYTEREGRPTQCIYLHGDRTYMRTEKKREREKEKEKERKEKSTRKRKKDMRDLELQTIM